jgi:hypothetical protein
MFLSYNMTEPYVVSDSWKKSSDVVAFRIMFFSSYTLLPEFYSSEDFWWSLCAFTYNAVFEVT